MKLDKFREECGVFGIINHPEASHLTYLGLYALQHRGQEGAGIVSSNGSRFYLEKGMGLVTDLFKEDQLRRLPGDMAIGHNRYSTTGESHVKNVQPLLISYALGNLALGHNGNLVNAQLLRSELEAYGAIFQSTTDSEVIIHLIALSREGTLLDRIVGALHKVRGAYSLVVLSEEGLYGIRDPYGFRPLSLGRLNEAWVLASESVAFDLIHAEFVRDVEPGEIIFIDRQGRVTSHYPFAKVPRASCIFEHIYFARPDSKIYGYNVYTMRRRLGYQLALEAPVEADLVIPVPDSGVAIALGYSEGTGLLDVLVGLDLVDAGQVVLDGVFGGGDVDVGGVELGQGGVEGGGLAGAGGPGDVEDAVGLGDHVAHLGERPRMRNQPLQAQHGVGLVEDAHADLLAPLGRDGGDAEVDGAVLQAHGDAAVLGHALLGDVELGENLHPRDQAHLRLFGQGLHHLQDAVNAEAHHHLFFPRLHVDVAGAALDRQGQDGVGQAHHRSVLGRAAQLGGRGGGLLGDLFHVDVLQALGLEGIEHGFGVAAHGGGHGVVHAGGALGGGLGALLFLLLYHRPVDAAHELLQVLAGADHRLDHGARDEAADVVEGDDVVRVHHGQRQA